MDRLPNRVLTREGDAWRVLKIAYAGTTTTRTVRLGDGLYLSLLADGGCDLEVLPPRMVRVGKIIDAPPITIIDGNLVM